MEKYCGSIEVGSEFLNGGIRVRVVRVVEHAGTVKVWTKRADGRAISHGIYETWDYEDDFRAKYVPVVAPREIVDAVRRGQFVEDEEGGSDGR